MKNSIDVFYLIGKAREIIKNPGGPDTGHFNRGIPGFPLLQANTEMIM
jgi:hypothetical protein